MKLALAGDTMLGRSVGQQIERALPGSLIAPEVVEAARSADVCVVNLECCISERGAPWPRRAFHFRAPPAAVEVLSLLGVDCVTLANNHALDFGPLALLDTIDHLERAGIRHAGGGRDLNDARAPAEVESEGGRLTVIALSDHPEEYAAQPDRPGIAYADLSRGEIPEWVKSQLGAGGDAPVLVSPHWGPNMTPAPLEHVRRAAAALRDAGATLIAGHSAHVFHGVAERVLFDLGDFLDDYAVHPTLRNDLGLLWLVDIERGAPVRVEAVPLKLEFCHTRLAQADEAEWIINHLQQACEALGTEVRRADGHALIELT